MGNNFYLYKVSSKWDKEQKKVRKVNLGYIGRVTADGIMEAHHRNSNPKPVEFTAGYSLEFGATWLLRMVGQDILDNLQKHFGSDANWIYTVAILRAAKHCAFRYLEHYYNVSYLSVVFPELPMSPGSLSNRMEQLGTRRGVMVDFMREYIPSENFYAIFDGTSIVCRAPLLIGFGWIFSRCTKRRCLEF